MAIDVSGGPEGWVQRGDFRENRWFAGEKNVDKFISNC